MISDSRRRAAARIVCAGLAVFIIASCGDEVTFPSGVQLAAGTWGGENAGLIVQDGAAHAHIGCTFGDIPGSVPIDDEGRFDVSGDYRLRAYPVVYGPSLPARFEGRVLGRFLELRITVDDTVEHRTVVLGPVSLKYGREPNMGPCPICRMVGGVLVR